MTLLNKKEPKSQSMPKGTYGEGQEPFNTNINSDSNVDRELSLNQKRKLAETEIKIVKNKHHNQRNK